MSSISSKEISYKKKIGHDGSDPVFEIGLIGGLHMIVKAKDGKTETLGAGPHRAVARHIAMRKAPGLVLTELNKSEDLDPSLFQDMLPKYEALTDALNSLK